MSGTALPGSSRSLSGHIDAELVRTADRTGFTTMHNKRR